MRKPHHLQPAHTVCGLITICLGLIVLAWSAAARAAAPDVVVTAKLLADHAPLVAGQDATLALQVDVVPGYHIQSAKPYDPFLKATRVEMPAVPGITAALPRYPVGQDVPAPPNTTDAGKLSVYEGRTWILLPIHIDAAAAPGARTVQVNLGTQACNDQACLPPETALLKLDVQIAPAGTTAVPQEADAFAAARRQKLLPAEAPAAEPQTEPEPAATATAPVAGDSELQLIRERPYQSANLKPNEQSVAYLLLLAILGGAILNIMPCVLPVIPLKILSLVQQAHGNRAAAVTHSVVFSLGVISFFVALAAALWSYQLFSGQHVVYGEQYNHPLFIISSALIVLALALSMLGVWTINPPQAAYGYQPQTGYMGSFMTGVLATVLATPCSAPLLGPVLFWALVNPLPVTMLAFGLVGVGMSVPYIILAAFPAGLDRLPRASRWTELLKQGLGLVMVGVALYLITRLQDPKLWPWTLAAALLVAAACWAWGQIPTPLMERGRIWTIRGIVVVLSAAAGVGLYHLASAPTETQWQPFTVSAMDKALADGRPVVIDWTADWCINCKFVESTVLENATVRAAFAEHRAALLRADISGDHPSPAQVELLHKLGGGSIPVLAIFAPARPYQPVVLQDIYTRKTVIDTLAHTAQRP